MLFDIEKTWEGPFGMTIKIGVPGVGLVVGFWAFMNWQRPVMGYLYSFIDLLVSHKWSFIFLGTTLVLAGFFLVVAQPSSKEGKKSFFSMGFVMLGLVSVGLAAASNQMNSVGRWTDASVGIIHFGENESLRGPIGDIVDDVSARLAGSIEYTSIQSDQYNLKTDFRRMSRYQFDVIVLDYGDPNMIMGGDFTSFVNPRTLYILTRPVNPELPLPPNVISLYPPLVEEVYAISSAIGDTQSPVTVVRSDTPRARLAARLLEYALATRGVQMDTTFIGRDVRDIELIPGHPIAMIYWHSYKLPNGSSASTPKVLEPTESGEVSVRSLSTLPYLSEEGEGRGEWRDNQVLALGTILEAHFLETNRPLDTRRSVDAAVKRLANTHLATMSREMRLVPRYSQTDAKR